MKNGQTMTMLLVFVVIAMTITSSAVAIIVTNNLGSSKFQQGIEAQIIAESAAEDALLRLLRNPNFNLPPPATTPSPTPIIIGNGSASLTITNPGNCSPNCIITAVGTSGDFIRKIQIVATYINNSLTVSSWNEIQ